MTRGTVIDITDQKFGRLTALTVIGKNYKNELIWRCRCDCGNMKDVYSSMLRNGNTRSCGCYNREALSNRRFGLNENYFFVPNIENSYWAGFIAADGNIYQPPDHNWQKKLGIGLSRLDVEHLERFVANIGFTGNIHSFTNGSGKDIVSIQITSNKICDDLYDNFGIHSKKSKTLEPPYGLSDEHMIKSFIKGYLDGDGSIGIYNNHPRFSMVGTKKFLEWVRYKLSIYNGIVLPTVKTREDGLSYVAVTGSKCRQVLFDLRSIDTPFLVRKWNKTVLM
jgi:hypothetical protein